MSWNPGDRVRHGDNPDLGPGRVIHATGREVVVEFPARGTTLKLAAGTTALVALRLAPGTWARDERTGERVLLEAELPGGRFRLSGGGVAGAGVAPPPGPETLRTAVESLQGAAIPVSALESHVLPARVRDYRPEMLDELTSAGVVLWVGREPLGPSDGRVSLYRADHVAPLLPSPTLPWPDGLVHRKIREHLATRGASFFPQIHAAIGGFFRETLESLWDLVWAGEVTNDTVLEKEPLEQLAISQQLMAFKDRGFWYAMDTLRDRNHLESLWQSGKAPWKVWK